MTPPSTTTTGHTTVFLEQDSPVKKLQDWNLSCVLDSFYKHSVDRMEILEEDFEELKAGVIGKFGEKAEKRK
jgi:hypothetical protein